MVGPQNDHPTIWCSNIYFDILGITGWDSAVGCWSGLRAYQTVNKEVPSTHQTTILYWRLSDFYWICSLQFALAWQITGRCSWSFSLIVQKTGESTSFGRNWRCPISFNPIVLCVPIQIEKSIKWKGNLLSLSYFFPTMVQEPHWVETRIIDCNQCLEYTKKVHWSSLVVFVNKTC